MHRILRAVIDGGISALLLLAVAVVYQWDTAARPRADVQPDVGEVDVQQTQETVVETLEPEPFKLAVAPASFDDMGRLLDELGAGYSYEQLSEDQLRDAGRLADFDVVFLTCSEPPPLSDDEQQRFNAALREFVGQGGTLYASDLRFDRVAAAFPEFVDPTAVAQGTVQDLDAQVVDSDLTAILGRAMPLHFDLDGWRPAAFRGPRVTVYLKGRFRTTAGIDLETPLLVKFPYRKGTVVFTSFHNEKQHSESERQLLKFLVFTTVTAQIESRITRTMVSGGFSPRQQNLLSANQDSPSVRQTYQHDEVGDLQFVLGFPRQGARLQMKVTSPDGKEYQGAGEETFQIDVPSAVAGPWRYTVTADVIPHPNFPFTLTVGEVSKEVRTVDAREPSNDAMANSPAVAGQGRTQVGNVTFQEVELVAKSPRKDWRIAVTPPRYDNMGMLLDQLGTGYQYDNIDMSQLSDFEGLQKYDVIFLTCNAEGPGTPRVAENLRRFVEGGGTLYASDLRYDMVAAAFPEAVAGNEDSEDSAIQQDVARLRAALAALEQPTAATTVLETLQAAGLTDTLAPRLAAIAEALSQAGYADEARQFATRINKTLTDAGQQPLDAADADKVAKALRARGLKINRQRYEASRNPAAAGRIQELRTQIAQLLAPRPSAVNEMRGAIQQLTAQVVDEGLRGVLGDEMPLHFDAGGWCPANFSGPDVTEFLRGNYQTASGQRRDAPLLTRFPWGDGTVIFTSFHNARQNSENEQKLLRYLVFTAVTAQEDQLVTRAMISGGFSPTRKSVMSHSVGQPSVTQTYRNEWPGRLRFALAFSGQDARLKFKIVAPGGQQYEKETQQTLVVEIPDAPLGDWQYTVTSLEVPYPNFPFTVNIGQQDEPDADQP